MAQVGRAVRVGGRDACEWKRERNSTSYETLTKNDHTCVDLSNRLYWGRFLISEPEAVTAQIDFKVIVCKLKSVPFCISRHNWKKCNDTASF